MLSSEEGERGQGQPSIEASRSNEAGELLVEASREGARK